jgi:hypothetical protein
MIEDGIIISPDTLRTNHVPPGQHLTTRFPVLHYESGGKIDTCVENISNIETRIFKLT